MAKPTKKIRDLPAKKKADKVRGGRTATVSRSATTSRTASPLRTTAKPYK